MSVTYVVLFTSFIKADRAIYLLARGQFSMVCECVCVYLCVSVYNIFNNELRNNQYVTVSFFYFFLHVPEFRFKLCLFHQEERVVHKYFRTNLHCESVSLSFV